MQPRQARVGLTLAIALIVAGLIVSFVFLWRMSAGREFPTESELIERFAEIRQPLDQVNALMLEARDRHPEAFAVFEAHEPRRPQETEEKEQIGQRLHAMGISAADTRFSTGDPCISYVLTDLYGTYMAYAYCETPPRHTTDDAVLEANRTIVREKEYGVFRPIADRWYLTVRQKDRGTAGR
ncbi:MAG: hypothetical protein OES25_14920 [Acidobacteriota bacterium]|nr:hypothetical protein [Acidobacteriota bacterium]